LKRGIEKRPNPASGHLLPLAMGRRGMRTFPVEGIIPERAKYNTADPKHGLPVGVQSELRRQYWNDRLAELQMFV